ncbi:hypothetical protein EDB95_3149 [Dinghuibacter silviterrae]|uniref:Uncharacterized protein n=1 Tax=Dinghuibacter silviterrae TaxID=1539049 RepID=A0A4R8DV85_9BACT|nr:hypothetical protein EDB95_3149 [Dinghuibacter silviterrae]
MTYDFETLAVCFDRIAVELRQEEGRYVVHSKGVTIYFPGFGEMLRYLSNTYPGLFVSLAPQNPGK